RGRVTASGSSNEDFVAIQDPVTTGLDAGSDGEGAGLADQLLVVRPLVPAGPDGRAGPQVGFAPPRDIIRPLRPASPDAGPDPRAIFNVGLGLVVVHVRAAEFGVGLHVHQDPPGGMVPANRARSVRPRRPGSPYRPSSEMRTGRPDLLDQRPFPREWS